MVCKIFGAAVIISILAMTTCGCSNKPAQPEKFSEPTLVATPAVMSVEKIALPMDAFDQTREQRSLEFQASDLLVGRCMARSGVTYRGNADARAEEASRFASEQKSGRFGLVDMKIAAQYGYHRRPGSTPGNGQESQNRPSKECLKEAKVALGKEAPPAEEFKIQFDLADDALALIQNDSRYKSMIDLWKLCMTRAGYSYTTPQTAAEDPAWRSTNSPTAAEIRAAQTDVRCKHEVNYLGLAVALMAAYQQRLMEKHSAVLQRLRTYYDERSRRVLALLNQSGR